MPSPGIAFLRPALLVAALAGFTPALFAQDSGDVAAPAHVQYVDGSATLERDGQVEPVALNMPVITGDRLHTTSGRVEILFSDASALDIDQDSTIDMLSATLLRLTAGRVMLTVAGAADPSHAVRYQIDTPTSAVQTDGPGEFRISALRSDETELAVMRGFAVFSNEHGSLDVRAGERSVAFDSGAPARTQVFNSARFDPFDRWIAERRDARLTASSSSQYLPRDLQVYGGALDRSGSWQYDASYGYVWYPTVAADWRPYYAGYWSSVPSYGWTWIGADVWSWPTHHYGRWGHTRSSWFWIPGRAFGPAWVSWASAADYVSWCPLGFDNGPVFSFSMGLGSWLGWTVIPRSSFGFHEYRVNRYAIAGDRLPRSAAFITHAAPPAAFGRPGLRTNAGAGPRSSFGRRDDPDIVRGPGGRTLSIPNAADSSRRRDVGDPRGRANPGSGTPNVEDTARQGRGRSSAFAEASADRRSRGGGWSDRPTDSGNPPRALNGPDLGRPNIADSARRIDGGDPARGRENRGLGIPNADVIARRRGQDALVRSGPGQPTPETASRPDVQDLTSRPPGWDRGFRQPLPDSYRRPAPDDSPRRPAGPRSDEPRFETAIPRYRPPAAPTPTPNRQLEGPSGRRGPDPSSPSNPPGVIYYRGPEQPSTSTPSGVIRRAPEAASPAGSPVYHRGPEGAPPPRSAPAAPAASDRSGGRDRGGERAEPRHEARDGGGGGGVRRR